MGALRYLLVIGLVGTLSLLTVADHVERTRLGYQVRALERERARLVEEEKACLLAYERAAVPEQLTQSARDLGVADAAELQGLGVAAR